MAAPAIIAEHQHQTGDVDTYLQQQAMDHLGLDRDTRQAVEAYFTPTVYDLGRIAVGGRLLEASAAHTGIDVDHYKGGTGARNGRSPAELSVTMAGKTAEWGLTDHNGVLLGGNKIVIEGLDELDDAEKNEVFQKLPRLTYEAGISESTSTAGDMGSNRSQYMDSYVTELHRVNPGYRHWRTGATGTSPEYGGNNYRQGGTGRILAKGTRFAREAYEQMHGVSKEVMDVSLLGFGNVGGWAVHELGKDSSYRISGIRDLGGTLRLADNQPGQPGIIITKEMVTEIADNLLLPKGTNKIELLRAAIEKNQPGIELIVDDTDILQVPADIHLPCAGKLSINDENVRTMVARIVVPGANIPYTLGAWRYLNSLDRHAEGKPRLALTDTTGNGGGVTASGVEFRAKANHVDRGTPMPTDAEVERLTVEAADRMYKAATAMAREFGTKDLGVSAKAVGIARIVMHLGLDLERRYADIVRTQTAVYN